MLKVVLLGKCSVTSGYFILGVVHLTEPVGVKNIQDEAAIDYLAGFGVAEGFFFYEGTACNSTFPVHFYFPECGVVRLAGVDVKVFTARVVSAVCKIIADWYALVVEVLGY